VKAVDMDSGVVVALKVFKKWRVPLCSCISQDSLYVEAAQWVNLRIKKQVEIHKNFYTNDVPKLFFEC
jgi:hypothetical protein